MPPSESVFLYPVNISTTTLSLRDLKTFWEDYGAGYDYSRETGERQSPFRRIAQTTLEVCVEG
jgi:hypothetical protein